MEQNYCNFYEIECLIAKKNKNFDKLFVNNPNIFAIKPELKLFKRLNEFPLKKKFIDIKSYESNYIISILKQSSNTNITKNKRNKKKQISFNLNNKELRTDSKFTFELK